MKKNHAKVFHFDLYGKRENKYDFLLENNIKSINWNDLNPNEPYYFFVKKNFEEIKKYEEGFKFNELFKIYSVGIGTKVDGIAVDISEKILINRVSDIITNKLDFDKIREKYILNDKTTWEYNPSLNLSYDKQKISKYEYRPFDVRYTYYDKKFLSRTRSEVMDNLHNHDNIALETARDGDFIFIGKLISDEHFIAPKSYRFPLYLYHDTNGQQNIGQTAERTPNLNIEIVGRIAERLGLAFVAEKGTSTTLSDPNLAAEHSAVAERSRSFAPIDILDYIYAVLHSPTYREKYKEFLKIDFPRVPYPKDKATFWNLVKLGGEIRQIHLLESPIVEKYITQYPIGGENVVTKPKYQDGKVYINDTQYFGNVPVVAWNFYIGGYQPAQKWLKDRKERKLEFDDILHYQKIIVALSETDRIMKEIDKIEIE